MSFSVYLSVCIVRKDVLQNNVSDLKMSGQLLSFVLRLLFAVSDASLYLFILSLYIYI